MFILMTSDPIHYVEANLLLSNSLSLSCTSTCRSLFLRSTVVVADIFPKQYMAQYNEVDEHGERLLFLQVPLIRVMMRRRVGFRIFQYPR